MNEQEQFEAWWKEDCDTTMNPYSNASMMYWAWEAWKAGRKAEREACAQLLLLTDLNGLKDTPNTQNFIASMLPVFAEAIRARRQDV
jgi:hypothetical protein